MKKLVLAIAMASAAVATQVSASEVDGLGVGVNYGLISGASLELTYPINNVLQLRGALSNGMKLSEESSDTDVDYLIEADGGVHRLALDYHPFESNFFMSAGYAINNFELSADATETGTVTVGDEEFENATLNLTGKFVWENAPTLSVGWGNSPAQGWGAIIELGVMFTDAPTASLNGTGSYDNGDGSVDVTDDEAFQNALEEEEKTLQDDVADFTVLPIFQAGVTYRF